MDQPKTEPKTAYCAICNKCYRLNVGFYKAGKECCSYLCLKNSGAYEEILPHISGNSKPWQRFDDQGGFV
jgi:hypothetical protein